MNLSGYLEHSEVFKPFMKLNILDALLSLRYASYRGAYLTEGNIKLLFSEIPSDVSTYYNSLTESAFVKTIDEIIQDRLVYYRTKSRGLKDSIYIANTKSGISVQNSAYLHKKLISMSYAIDEGLLPTALEILDKEMIDFIFTQEKKDLYKQLITQAMI